nr:hypothetical protein [Tanacetum cinerariifolium]
MAVEVASRGRGKERRWRRTKKYAELSVAEKIQTDCDMKYGSIHSSQHYSSTYPSQLQFNQSYVPPSYPYQSLVDSDFAVPVFSLGDDLIAYLNKAIAFLTAIASSMFHSTNNQLKTFSNPRNQDTIQDGRVTVQQTENLDTYDSDCDDISNGKAVLMASVFNYGYDVISEVPHSETYLTDMENQSVHVTQDFEQSSVVDFSDNEIHSDSNIILNSQYLQETQLTIIQDTALQ